MARGKVSEVMVNSIQKGKAGERELANFLSERGFGAMRSQQHSGKAGDADLISELTGFHIECKRVEAFQLYKALAQAESDRDEENIPIVMHRRSKEQWVAVLYLEDFLNVVRALPEFANLRNNEEHDEEAE